MDKINQLQLKAIKAENEGNRDLVFEYRCMITDIMYSKNRRGCNALNSNIEKCINENEETL